MPKFIRDAFPVLCFVFLLVLSLTCSPAIADEIDEMAGEETTEEEEEEEEEDATPPVEPETVEEVQEDVEVTEGSQDAVEDEEGGTEPESGSGTTDAVDRAILEIGKDLHELKYLLAPMELQSSEATQYLPEGAAGEISAYMIPFLWGMGAGLVAYLIGLCWRSAERLMGLVG